MLPTSDEADSDQRGQTLQMKRKRQRVGQTEEEASVPRQGNPSRNQLVVGVTPSKLANRTDIRIQPGSLESDCLHTKRVFTLCICGLRLGVAVRCPPCVDCRIIDG
jgi:hypothetical protein